MAPLACGVWGAPPPRLRVLTMGVLHVRCKDRSLVLVGAEFQSVREILDTSDLRTRAACSGTGACGACAVRVVRGDVNPPTLAEQQKLTAEERDSGLRLACQVRPRGPVEVDLEDPAPPSQWSSIPPDCLAPLAGRVDSADAAPYGVAVDLGTTHIRVSLLDRRRGVRIASRRGLNPQAGLGADILTRLDAARQPEVAAELSGLVRTAIIHALRDMFARDLGEGTGVLHDIGHVLVVGNTAMLVLLAGHGAGALLDPSNWERAVDVTPRELEDWREAWGMPNAKIELAEPVAGFVGSDLTADLLVTDLAGGPAGSLLIDVGTNTELALWDGSQVTVTSVAGGPAFEGVGIRFGMPASSGAIWRIGGALGAYTFHTVGGAAPAGFCGTGLIDALALLRRDGVLKASGRFAGGREEFLFDTDNPRTALCRQDVDSLQRAKAAVGAAMATLLEGAGLTWQDLRRVCVCGAFGRGLQTAHAQAIGLLPEIASDRVELYAEAALGGGEVALLRPQPEAPFSGIRGRLSGVNLARSAIFADAYAEHLWIRPTPTILSC